MKLFIITFFSFIFVIDVIGKRTKIIRGVDANIKDFPYMVSFRMPTRNEHFCGGVIITDWHVLTAAHCLHTREEYYLVIKIFMGRNSSWSTSLPHYEIDRVLLHAQYIPASPDHGSFNDVAVVKVTSRIIFNDLQKKATISRYHALPGSILTMIGWGLVEYPSTFFAEQLQRGRTKVISNKDCSSRIGNTITSSHICTYSEFGVGGCIGDSGGPLIVQGEVLGIYSYSFPCANGFPDVFTRLYSVLDFINYAVTT